MSSSHVWIPGIPAPQPRPRAQVVCGHAHIYTPRVADAWRDTVTLGVLGLSSLEGAVCVRLDFALRRPPSHLRKNGELRKGRPLFPIGRGTADLDNAAKLVLDAMESQGVFVNDSRVADLILTKRYARPGHEGVRVEITKLGGLDVRHEH